MAILQKWFSIAETTTFGCPASGASSGAPPPPVVTCITPLTTARQ